VVDASGEPALGFITTRETEDPVNVLVAILLLLVAAVLAISRSSRSLHRRRTSQPRHEPSVTLSVLPGGRAVVTLDAEGDESATALAHLVDPAVGDAFALASVETVEVRRRDGTLVDRRSRPALGWPATPMPTTPPAEGRPPLALREPGP
jgi:hypothetical protein